MGQLLDKILFGISVVLMLGLLTGLLAPYVNPEITTIPAFFGLVFPYMLLLLTLVGIYGIVRKRWLLILFPLIGLLVSWGGIQKTLAVNLQSSQGNTTDSLALMSYNVQGLGRYQSDTIVNRYLELIKQQQADILCLQEFYTQKGTVDNNLLQVSEAGQFPHQYCIRENYSGKDHFFGLAVFSKWPIVNNGFIPFEQKGANGCIFIDIKRKADTIRVMNAHLQSTHLFKDEQMDEPNNTTRLLRNVDGKISRLHEGFIERSLQSRKIAQAIRESPHPVVLSGDLNDMPLSYMYQTLTQELEDAFLASGNGIGQTYAKRFRFLRIDYMLYQKPIEPFRFQILDTELSDHYPVLCTFEVGSH